MKGREFQDQGEGGKIGERQEKLPERHKIEADEEDTRRNKIEADEENTRRSNNGQLN